MNFPVNCAPPVMLPIPQEVVRQEGLREDGVHLAGFEAKDQS